jgi:hypothetical protein
MNQIFYVLIHDLSWEPLVASFLITHYSQSSDALTHPLHYHVSNRARDD